ncbi:hypothetical protein C8R44DRAFT_726311 [Mycena epipterygia]|nr:hypothetical protein C8R44DRAFT_726311 [Mycena epipterygia]
MKYFQANEVNLPPVGDSACRFRMQKSELWAPKIKLIQQDEGAGTSGGSVGRQGLAHLFNRFFDIQQFPRQTVSASMSPDPQEEHCKKHCDEKHKQSHEDEESHENGEFSPFGSSTVAFETLPVIMVSLLAPLLPEEEEDCKPRGKMSIVPVDDARAYDLREFQSLGNL